MLRGLIVVRGLWPRAVAVGVHLCGLACNVSASCSRQAWGWPHVPYTVVSSNTESASRHVAGCSCPQQTGTYGTVPARCEPRMGGPLSGIPHVRTSQRPYVHCMALTARHSDIYTELPLKFPLPSNCLPAVTRLGQCAVTVRKKWKLAGRKAAAGQMLKHLPAARLRQVQSRWSCW